MTLQWKKNKILGGTPYGKVYLASPVGSSSQSSSLVAVKSANIELSETLQKERKFLDELRGEANIIHCFGDDISKEEGRQVYNLLLEYAPGGSLDDLIRKNKGNIPESHVAYYAYMILKGLYAVHECETIHCNLKPGNILVFPNADGNKNGLHQLRIADFRLAKKVWEVELHEWGRMGYNARCTPLYAAPESVACGCEAAGDIWSLGCVVVEMITGEPVWSSRTIDELLDEVVHEEPKIPENLCEEGKDFLARCFERSVPKRWTAEELLDHPFIVKNLKLLGDGSCHPSSGQSYQMNPFGIDEWICTNDLFSTSSLKAKSSSFASYCPVTDNETEESGHSFCLPSESSLHDVLYNSRSGVFEEKLEEMGVL